MAQDRGAVFREAGNLALQGFDPVTYFSADKPQRGRAEFAVAHTGASYQFVSADHAARFKADPQKHLSQYAGHCSWAASRGYKGPGSPTDYQVVDGKLYLNYNAEVHRRWQTDTKGNIEKGDRNWLELRNK